MRRSTAVTGLLAGMAIGYSATVVMGSSEPIQPSIIPPVTTSTTTNRPTTTPPSSTSTSSTATTERDQVETDEVYLVWATGGLPQELVAGLDGIEGPVSIVTGDLAELDTPDRSVIPLDAIAIDPDSFRAFDPQRRLSDLRPGTVALSDSSARLRDMAAGDSLSIGGHSFEVAAVVPDALVGAAEVVFHRSDPESPVTTPRYALLRSASQRSRLEAEVRSVYHGPAPLRIRTSTETQWLRHGDAVLPQVFIKQALGEFSYTDGSGSSIDQDPAYTERWIVGEEVPILGEVVCHRAVVEMLAGAMADLVEEGLDYLVKPSGYAGCWNPRLIRSAAGEPSGLSRHSWGAAVDLNAAANPQGSAGTQDPRLVEVMERWGFIWGGDWLIPDPMHFEYGVLPSRSP